MYFKKVICFTMAMALFSVSVCASPRLPADPETGWITISKCSGGAEKVMSAIPSNYGDVVTSYLYANNDNTFSVVDYSNNTINIDTYNSQTYEWIKNKKIAMELPLFGGVYCGSKYNFIVFGQNNTTENDNTVTFKTVKYSKNWEKIGVVDYSNNNTIKPFEAGSLRMVEHDNYLYVRSCHQMYKSSDGFNHQSNITYSINIDKMEIADEYSGVMNDDYGYVSHSFDQYVAIDDGKLVALDLGDAYPRSVVLIKYNDSLNKGKFTNSNGLCTVVDMLEISGNTGDNYTGVTIGGFEVSKNNYIAAISTIDQKTKSSARDIMLLIVNKKDTSKVKQVRITKYANTEKGDSASKPYIVKLPDGNYQIIWQTFSKEGGFYGIQQVTVDENGTMLTDITTLGSARLSPDCQPICINNKIVWYTDTINANNELERSFYKLDIPYKK